MVVGDILGGLLTKNDFARILVRSYSKVQRMYSETVVLETAVYMLEKNFVAGLRKVCSSLWVAEVAVCHNYLVHA
jgi:hypothetical protein